MVNNKLRRTFAFEEKISRYFKLKVFCKSYSEAHLKQAPWLPLCRRLRCCKLENIHSTNKSDWMEIFTCKCGMILHNPTTLPCGHTVCKHCFLKAESCVICGGTLGKEYRLNVTLAGLLERWFPDQYKSGDFLFKAKTLVDEGKYQQSMELIIQSIKLVGEDSVSLCLRSEVNLKLCNMKQAYKDVRKSCKLNSQNGEALFMLGAVYAALNKVDSAVEAYQQCLECCPDDPTLYNKVCENLDALLSMPLGEEIVISEDDEENKVVELSKPSLPCESKTDCDENPREMSEILSHQETKTRKRRISDTHINTDKVCIKEQIEKETHNDKDENMSKPLSSNNNMPSTSYETESTKLKNAKKQCLTENKCEKDCEKKARTDSNQTPQLDDFECKLCFNILFKPITTPCGHIFCQNCLERCIDHNQACPICRAQLEFHEDGVGNVTTVFEKAAEFYFPKELNSRIKKHEDDMKTKSRAGLDEDVEVPIFCCILVFPTLQSQFHVFEPRYRLMLRECLESGSRRFAVCMSNKEGGHSNYGTIVEVKLVKFLADGRSIVDVVGERRFKIHHSNALNGIPYAKVEYFEDDLDLCRTDIQREQTMNKCMAVYNQLNDYIEKLHPAEKECIFSALGPIPAIDQNPFELANGASWVWWATSALPLGYKAKFVIFKSKSLLERVTLLNRFLNLLSKVNRGNEQPAQMSGL